MTAPASITAADVLRLLEAKHSKDVFVSECKNGPTHAARNGEMVRMDGWAMPRSWAHPETTGYEIKVYRSDFLNDRKWPEYLGLCHQLYFVAPKGVIERDEVDARCGLIEVSKNAKRLITRKKAPLRDVELPESLFRYVLMCRSTIGAEVPKVDRAQRWKDWLAKRDDNYGVGWEVSQVIARKVAERVGEIEDRNRELLRENKTFAHVRDVMEEAGIANVREFQASRIARAALTSESLVDALSKAREQVDKALQALSSSEQGRGAA